MLVFPKFKQAGDGKGEEIWLDSGQYQVVREFDHDRLLVETPSGLTILYKDEVEEADAYALPS